MAERAFNWGILYIHNNLDVYELEILLNLLEDWIEYCSYSPINY